MWAPCRFFKRHQTLLSFSVLAILLCLTIVNFLEQSNPQHVVRDFLKQAKYPTFRQVTQNLVEQVERLYWEAEYASRVLRMREVCNKEKIVTMQRVSASNRHLDKVTNCPTPVCPIIVPKRSVLFCFVPKVASTLVKRLFLRMSGMEVDAAWEVNSTAFHNGANDALYRVSPMYYPTHVTRGFFKILFVRHPFDRLVSAFRDKAEKPREEMKFFYDRYFDPTMKRLRPLGSPIDQITFPEFVWMLTHTAVRDYDVHWAPYWSRCDPCLVDYDFIGKLETAERDFPYAFEKMGIRSDPEWWKGLGATPRSLALSYFLQVPEEEVLSLYEVYKLDFELFGYSVQEFFLLNYTENAVR